MLYLKKKNTPNVRIILNLAVPVCGDYQQFLPQYHLILYTAGIFNDAGRAK